MNLICDNGGREWTIKEYDFLKENRNCFALLDFESRSLQDFIGNIHVNDCESVFYQIYNTNPEYDN